MATPEAATEAGIPQLDFATFPNQIFWLVVSFAVLYLIISRIVLPRMDGTLEKRRRHRAATLARAEDLNEQAEKVIKESDQAFSARKAEAEAAMDKARSDAQAISHGEMVRVSAQLSKEAETASQKLAQIRAAAPQEIVELANSVASQILVRMMPGVADAAIVNAQVRAQAEVDHDR